MAEAVFHEGVYGWLLTDEEYSHLRADSDFLENLRDAGVDNWDGYHYGYSGYSGEED